MRIARSCQWPWEWKALEALGGPEEVGGMRVLLAVAGACLLAATAACAPARVVVAGNPAGAVRLGGAGTSGGGGGNAERVRGLASLDKAGLPHGGGISCASPGNGVVGGFYDPWPGGAPGRTRRVPARA